MKKDQIKTEPKLVVKKEKKVVVKPTIELVSYTIHAVIPTGMYANIQPQITVKAGTIEEASQAVMIHIVELFAKYAEEPRDGKPSKFTVNVVKTENTPEITAPEAKKEDVSTVSEPFTKAKKAIISCMGNGALDIIKEQINKSTKLTDEERIALIPFLKDKWIELNPGK